MPTLYGFTPSGNCYKPRLLMTLLGQPFRWVETDSARGATRTPEFLAKNPNGRVPLMEFEDGRRLSESNAMLWYLGEGSAYLPSDPWQRALVLQWMFFEQYSHEPYVAVARFISGWLPSDSPRRAELPRLVERGHDALAVMEQHLAGHRWLAGDAFGIADIALFAYTHTAPEGGIALDAYPGILAWLARVRSVPGFVPLLGPWPQAA
jgi:glutathione S-transferase